MRYTKKGAIFVVLQLLLFGFFLVDIDQLNYQSSQWLIKVGQILFNIGIIVIILSFIQLNKHLSPFPMPKSGSKLIKIGLYSLIRHPIYTGILVTFFGGGLRKESFYKIGITILLFCLFFVKSTYEERLLLKTHQDYAEYMKNTYRFFPWLF